jgi:hypothetical protein
MPSRALHYTIVVRGELGSWLEPVMGGMRVRHAHGLTEIHGPVADAAQLRGLLDRLADLGLDLVRVNPDEEEPG